MVRLDLDAADCKNAAEIIELYLPQACKDFYDAGEFDNIDWMRSIIAAFDELTEAGKGNRSVGGG